MKEIYLNEINGKRFVLKENLPDIECNIYGDHLPKFNSQLSIHQPKFKVINFNDPMIDNNNPITALLKPYEEYLWRFPLPRPKLNIFGNIKFVENRKQIVNKISSLFRTSEELNTPHQTDPDQEKPSLDGHKNILNKLKCPKKIESKKNIKNDKELKVSKEYIQLNIKTKEKQESAYLKYKKMIVGFSSPNQKEITNIPPRKIKLKNECDLYLDGINLLRNSNPIAFEIIKKNEEYDLKRLKLKRKQAEFYASILASKKN